RRLLRSAARSASCLACSGRAGVVQLSSDPQVALLPIGSCVLARHPPVAPLGVHLFTGRTTSRASGVHGQRDPTWRREERGASMKRSRPLGRSKPVSLRLIILIAAGLAAGFG